MIGRWTVRSLAPLLSLLIVIAACSEPLEFADWTISVPEGTRIVEYAAATEEDRAGNRIEAVEDLVIGARADDDNYSFYRPTTVLVDSVGLIYVFDSGNTRFQVFDADGEYLRTQGKEGSGPGEFRGLGRGFISAFSTIAADRLIAFDLMQSRISVWAQDGTHEGDHAVTGTRFSGILAGLDNGSFVVETVRRVDGVSTSVVAALSESGELHREYLELPRSGNLRIGDIGISNPAGGSVFAVVGDGTVYASNGDEYQVLAFEPGGEVAWALRVAHQRAAFTDDDRARIVDLLAENFPDLDTSSADWPALLGSISRLAVDGHGHLYVFGFVPPMVFPAPEDSEVDVYAPDGERLFSGTMPLVRWTAAAGDFVYALRANGETDEQEPVRYRLIEPFE